MQHETTQFVFQTSVPFLFEVYQPDFGVCNLLSPVHLRQNVLLTMVQNGDMCAIMLKFEGTW